MTNSSHYPKYQMIPRIYSAVPTLSLSLLCLVLGLAFLVSGWTFAGISGFLPTSLPAFLSFVMLMLAAAWLLLHAWHTAHDREGVPLRGDDGTWSRRVLLTVGCAATVLVVPLLHQDWLLLCRPNCDGVDLAGAVLYRPYSAEREVGMINMQDVSFRDAIFRGADLRGTFVRTADFRNVNLRGADLRDADFAWSNFTDADVRSADLRRANLYAADLRGADLRDADLRDAFLAEANLSGADLRGADLRATTFRGTILDGATYDRTTTWPVAFDPRAAGANAID